MGLRIRSVDITFFPHWRKNYSHVFGRCLFIHGRCAIHTAMINTSLMILPISMSLSQAERTISRFKTSVCALAFSAKKEASFHMCMSFFITTPPFLMVLVKSYQITASNA